MAEQKIPELWWSAKECFVYVDRSGAAPRYIQIKDSTLFGVPADAVRLVAAPAVTEDNLIDQIRAVLDAYYDPEANIGTEVNVVARITRILDSAPPAQTTGLPRLAELAEQAGKIRTAEWLRTCAALPPDEWPPAPTYKGAVVHLDDPRPDFAAMTKAQLRDLRLRIVSELRQRRALSELTGEANRG